MCDILKKKLYDMMMVYISKTRHNICVQEKNKSSKLLIPLMYSTNYVQTSMGGTQKIWIAIALNIFGQSSIPQEFGDQEMLILFFFMIIKFACDSHVNLVITFFSKFVID